LSHYSPIRIVKRGVLQSVELERSFNGSIIPYLLLTSLFKLGMVFKVLLQLLRVVRNGNSINDVINELTRLYRSN